MQKLAGPDSQLKILPPNSQAYLFSINQKVRWKYSYCPGKEEGEK